MKRRKIVGLVLFTATIVYLVASFLALYQNQRVELEKGMEKAIKAYSEKENSEVKELSKDIDLWLEEKADINDLNEQRLIYEGSLARMENHVSNVTSEITSVEKYVTNIAEKIVELQKQNINANDKITGIQNQITDIKNQILILDNLQNEAVQNKESILALKNEIKNMNDKITVLEEELSEKEVSQKEEIEKLQNRLIQWEEKINELEENILFYRFDEESQTLNIYGKKEENTESE